jgi:hypothetical protein
VEQIDFYFDAVRMKAPVSHMAAALVPTFCSLYGTFGAPCATDQNALLKALVWMTIDAKQTFEKDHSISGHGDLLLTIPPPPVGRPKRHGPISAHITPARSITSAGEYQRMIFTVVIDT